MPKQTVKLCVQRSLSSFWKSEASTEIIIKNNENEPKKRILVDAIENDKKIRKIENNGKEVKLTNLRRGKMKNENKIDETNRIREIEETETISDNEIEEDNGSVNDILVSQQDSTITWGKNEDVPYSALTEVFQKIETTKRHSRIQDYLSTYFVHVIETTPRDLLPSIYLCVNQVAPEFEGIELWIGHSTIIKAISSATGSTKDHIQKEYDKSGDLGKAAEKKKNTQGTIDTPKPLTVKRVFSELKNIALSKGRRSQEKKIGIMQRLFGSCRGSETRYLTCALQGKLGIQLGLQTVLSALGDASIKNTRVTSKEAEAIIKQVYNIMPTFDTIIPLLLEKGIKELPNLCYLTPGIPVKPMLATPATVTCEKFKKFTGIKFTCEYKYDGERAQIHKSSNGEYSIFSRNSENQTGKYPDLIEFLKTNIPASNDSFVLDSEVVAWDRGKKILLPFQTLSTRSRKDVTTNNITVQVIIMAFDILYFNGRSLIKEPFYKRREILTQNFTPVEGRLMFAIHKDYDTTDDLDDFFNESIENGCEGLMVKTLYEKASYKPSKRSSNWLKLKKDYINGIGDTLDLVPIGAYTGHGKRVGVYGSFLMACYDEDNEEYQCISRVGTGFTDEDLKTLSQTLNEHIIDKPGINYIFDDSLIPDIWFDTVAVWEVKPANFSISRNHKAAFGIIDPEKGISIRFSRFIRIRDDKRTENATSSSQIADLYKSQPQQKNKDLSDS